MRPLSSGDDVVVIAPAGRLRTADIDLLDGAVELLSCWGLRVRTNVPADGRFYLAGSDEQRAAALQDALADESVRAIFCTRGGYGSQRLLRLIDWTATAGPTVLVGFSDITALHLSALRELETQRLPLNLVHGPNVATRQLLDPGAHGTANRAHLRRDLFEPKDTSFDVRFISPGTAEGPLIGGCLSIVASQIGTPFFPSSLAGAILFLEDVGEAPYKIDRMLTQLRNSGLLDSVAGLVFGVMHDCSDSYNRLDDVIIDALSGLDVPVAIGLRSGHGPINSSVRLGATATLLDQQSRVLLSSSNLLSNLG